jgi:hypothetical protein
VAGARADFERASLTQTAVFADVGEVGQFYVDGLIRFWKADEHIIWFYSLLHAMDFISFATRTNDQEMTKRLLEWMNILVAKLESYQGFSSSGKICISSSLGSSKDG